VSGLRLTIATALCLVALGFVAAHASAANYHAYLCKVPYGPSAGLPAPTDGVGFTTNSAHGTAGQSCATGGAISASLDSAAHAYAEGASAIYDTPPGLSITAFRVWRHMAVAPGDGAGAAPFTNIGYGAGVPAEGGTCQVNGGCTGRGSASSPFAPENEVAVAGLSGVTQVRFDAFCGGTGGTCPAPAGGGKTAVIDVFAADMLLDDASAPVVSGVGGPLVSGGALTGVQSVSFKATDVGGGVHRGSIIVDGQVVADGVLDSAGGTCADLAVAPDGRPSFAGTQPCPATVNGVLTLNTDLLAPGSHAFAFRVSDTAGNQTLAGASTITTTGPRPAGANGSGASRFAKLTARFASGKPTVRRLGFNTRPTITGRLLDERGGAIAGAAIDVLVRPRAAGQRSTPIATATTGADGRFRLVLPSGPSRTITVAYTAFTGDPKPSATVRLRALVRARLTVSISPRSPRAGRPVRFSGRLLYQPRSKVLVAIQARQGRTWRTVDTVETRSGGRYSWPYRFPARQAGRTFVFRARVKSPNYPFEPGTTKAIRVHVRR
jgi:hypothetical protein